jgi:hypothetical protein
MRLTGMSEEAITAPFMGLPQHPNGESIPTVDSFEDVDALKRRVQKLSVREDDSGGGGGTQDCDTSVCASLERESTLSLSSEDTLHCDDTKSDANDTPQIQIQEPECDVSKPSATKPGHVRQHLDISAGLLMSPSLFTEDIPVDVASGSSNKFSSVCENISLPLVYLPTTKQIVNGEKRGSNLEGNLEATSGHFESRSCSDFSPVNGLDVPGSESFSPHLLHTGSAPCELDRFRGDPDRVTLNSIESFNSNTFSCDPTTRLYDTSSLSSISTGTDFSVSALSTADDYGESRLMVDGGDDGAFTEVNLHGQNTFESGGNPSLDSGFEDRGAKPKKRSFSGFLSR